MRHQNRQGLVRALAIVGWVLIAGLIASPLLAGDTTATLRGTAINTEASPPAMPGVENKDLKRVRNYPEQPPTIPHTIRDYQVDKNVNKCMTCHSRRAVGESQAPMVSVTHFMDRDGQVRATVSPRRYFCNQCHVPQLDAKPLVANDFIDAEEIIKAGAKSRGRN